jgi:hydroxyacylglutathione hydrolase
MLEDNFTWVLRKALKGLNLAPSEAASLAGLSETAVLAFSRGDFSADTARRLAPALGLNPEALANHDLYLPKPLALPSIHRIDLPFGEERVNAWLVWTGDTAILFDTGYAPTSCTVALDALAAPPLDRVFVTHAHVDHIGGIPSFMMRGNLLHGANIDNTLPMKPGESIRCGDLVVSACDLSGSVSTSKVSRFPCSSPATPSSPAPSAAAPRPISINTR